ncbi:L,D-transpeptidase family protein [Glaesserella parasuis]|nr:L,D-transpeptidase family protein [Glaesserella parasuis]MDP0118818.1 L,D-transpeptidase family protein [Glaesserella parasuis]
MKTLKFLPIVLLSSTTFADPHPAPVVEVTSLSQQTASASSEDKVLPQFSFEAQKARAIALAKEAEYRFQLEEEKRIATEKLIQAEQRILQETAGYHLLLSNTTAKIYLDNEFMLLWKDKTAEKLFLKEYAVFAVSGVSQKSANALQQILNMNDGFARDILLTDSFLDYLYYTENVDKNANQWLYNLGSYSTKPPAEYRVATWIDAIKQEHHAQFIANLAPKNHIYQETVKKLFEMSSNDVLNHTSNKEKKSKKAKENSVVSTTSFTKLALNSQRLRLIPSFSNGIFVNIPSYQLYYFRDGKLALQSKVIVGRDDRRTPVMYSKLSNVVVNPPWNVPSTIKNKDLVPKLRKDPSLADRLGYEILDGKGNKLSAYNINWAAYEGKNNFPYHIRQKVGDDSALGRYKFNMPSSDAIYLHDTPNRGLFSKSSRALSSGCVRVAKADELATLLLSEAGWSLQKKQDVLASKKTTSAPIRSDNPVYLYYVTSWVEGGKVYTLPDIYQFDKSLPKVNLDWEKIKSVI